MTRNTKLLLASASFTAAVAAPHAAVAHPEHTARARGEFRAAVAAVAATVARLAARPAPGDADSDHTVCVLPARVGNSKRPSYDDELATAGRACPPEAVAPSAESTAPTANAPAPATASGR